MIIYLYTNSAVDILQEDALERSYKDLHTSIVPFSPKRHVYRKISGWPLQTYIPLYKHSTSGNGVHRLVETSQFPDYSFKNRSNCISIPPRNERTNFRCLVCRIKRDSFQVLASQLAKSIANSACQNFFYRFIINQLFTLIHDLLRLLLGWMAEGEIRGAKFNLVEAFRCSFLFLLSSSLKEVRVWERNFQSKMQQVTCKIFSMEDFSIGLDISDVIIIYSKLKYELRQVHFNSHYDKINI